MNSDDATPEIENERRMVYQRASLICSNFYRDATPQQGVDEALGLFGGAHDAIPIHYHLVR
jgi:hypothetical protein